MALWTLPARPGPGGAVACRQSVPLRPKTLALLAYLVAHAGQLVTKEALLDAVWPETAVDDGVLKTGMNELRKALGETAKAPQWIATVRGRGYRFVAAVVEHAAAIPRPTGAPSLETPDTSNPCLGFLSRVLWNLGYSDQALQHSQGALTLAQELGHPFSLAFTLRQTISLHQLCGDVHEVLARTQRLLTLATEHGFAQLVATGTRDRGWALTMHGHMAEALGKVGEADEGLHLLAEGLALAEQHEERVYEAELHRLKGVLLLAQSMDHHAAAHTCFQQAMTVARRQQAKSLELRAAMNLSRLWQQQGMRTEARVLLAEVYGWFTEGFDTVDLREARTLLEELA